MKIQTIITGAFDENCFLLLNNNHAVVIDPGADADVILETLRRENATVDAYLLTHGHADHICALADLYNAQPAPVYFHAADFEWAFTVTENQIPPYYSIPQKPPAQFIHPDDGEKLSIAGIDIIVIATPGHTPGCVSYYIEKEKALFAGDTLFKGSCGRTDLPGGNGRVLSQSLKKLAALPPDTAVYSGHGDSSTIGHENRTNFFMQQAAK